MSALPTSTLSAPATTLFSPSKRFRFNAPLEADDVQVAALRSDPDILKFLRFMSPTTVPAVAERRLTRSKDARILDYNVFLDSTGELVGMTGVFHIDETQKSCETGILVCPRLHGKGASTEILYTLLRHIFEERGFHRTVFQTSEDNLPMRGWLEKAAGARLEATRVDAWTDSAEGWVTVKEYAILDREWPEMKERLEKRMGIVNSV